MDAAMMVTAGQFLALCGTIITISGAATVVFNLITKVVAPNKVQNARLDAIEIRLREHDEYFKRDLRRFEELEDSNRHTQRALLALLAHAIDGNDIDALKEAKRGLERFLIER